MSWHLLLREIGHRRVSALLCVLIVAFATTAIVFSLAQLSAAKTATTRIQRDMGLNLLILPEQTDLADYWDRGWSEHTIPESYLERLHEQDVANRLIPLLQRRVDFEGFPVLLTGIAPEIFKRDQKKKPVFGLDPAAGRAVIGNQVAKVRGLAVGESFELLGRDFEVETVLQASGSREDLRIYARLADVQEMLNLPGQLNEIQALECHCGSEIVDPVAELRRQLGPLLPGTRIVRREALADARRQQRILAEHQLARLAPTILVLCGLIVGALFALNVRDRRAEIGVFRSLGYSSPKLFALLLGRAAVLGSLGSLCGLVLGSLSTHEWAADFFLEGFAPAELDWDQWLILGVVGPTFAVACALIPATWAVSGSPAEALRDAA